MKKLILLSLLTGSLFAGGADIYKSACATCHGLNAEKIALGKSKVLATLSEEEIISDMMGYKAGTFGGQMKALMIPQAQKLSDDEIKAVAAYVQTIK